MLFEFYVYKGLSFNIILTSIQLGSNLRLCSVETVFSKWWLNYSLSQLTLLLQHCQTDMNFQLMQQRENRW